MAAPLSIFIQFRLRKSENIHCVHPLLPPNTVTFLQLTGSKLTHSLLPQRTGTHLVPANLLQVSLPCAGLVLLQDKAESWLGWAAGCISKAQMEKHHKKQGGVVHKYLRKKYSFFKWGARSWSHFGWKAFPKRPPLPLRQHRMLQLTALESADAQTQNLVHSGIRTQAFTSSPRQLPSLPTCANTTACLQHTAKTPTCQPGETPQTWQDTTTGSGDRWVRIAQEMIGGWLSAPFYFQGDGSFCQC